MSQAGSFVWSVTFAGGKGATKHQYNLKEIQGCLPHRVPLNNLPSLGFLEQDSVCQAQHPPAARGYLSSHPPRGVPLPLSSAHALPALRGPQAKCSLAPALVWPPPPVLGSHEPSLLAMVTCRLVGHMSGCEQGSAFLLVAPGGLSSLGFSSVISQRGP